MKRIVAMLLTAAMLIALFPAVWAADSAGGTAVLTAEEVPGETRLQEAASQGEARESVSQAYAPDEIVTVIVELEGAPLLENFDGAPAAAGTLSAGEAVSSYLERSEVQAQSQALLRQQDAAAAEIQALSGEAQVTAQWTTLMNGMAVRVPYGKLEEIKALPGVRRAYVEHVFDRPQEPVTEAGSIASYSYDMVGLQEVWDAGYTGKGMLVAILDTGLDLNWQAYANPHVVSVHEAFTDNSFKSEDATGSLRYNAASMAAFLKSNTLNAEFRGGSVEMTYAYNALYKNQKVPFAYDYADLDLNVQPSESDHGTHVAGTIAGYAETAEGQVKFSGVAPDAQIMMMKVFPDADGGAQESDILCALEDAMKLGADVVNLSLGSDNGFAQDDTAQQEMYSRIEAAGIILMTSAGNAAYSSSNSNYGSYAQASDPEISMMSSPAVYASNLAVASINNTVEVQTVFTWTDSQGQEHRVAYNDPNGVAMKYKFAGKDPVTVIPAGYGTYNDYYAAGFRSYYGYGGEKGVTGVALVQRGNDLSFADKINNATSFYWSFYDSSRGTYVNECPVQAVIVYDNVEGDLVYMSVDGTSLTSAFISKADGEAIIEAINAGYEVKISVQEEDDLNTWDEGGQMSEFTSWGAGPSLELKPEITAPGGNIWSTITGGSSADGSTGSYGMMSGTSMAAPHMTGVGALVEQYVQSKELPSKQEDAALTQQLLVSTAVPQADGSGVYYSPRQQGAGLVNAAAAIKTPAYITVDGQNVGKLELKDDPEKTGSYTLSFNVVNMTWSTLTYNAKAVLLRPATGTAETQWGTRTLMLDSDVLIREVDLGTIQVPGRTTGDYASTAFSQTVTLTEAEKQELDGLFENGTYVEGFIVLTDAQGENPQIGLPFLAFYGDWTAAPIFDRATWLDEVAEGSTYLDGECTWWPVVLGYYDGYSFTNLGQNIFDSNAANTQTAYHQENVTISPTGWFRSINDYELYQLREAKVMVVEVRDKETDELYYRDYAAYQFKSYYDANYGVAIPASLYYFTGSDWDGTDLEGNVLPSGTQCVYTVTAYGDGDYPTVYSEALGRYVTDVESIIPGEKEPTFNGHPMDLTGDVISFDVMVDSEAPKLVNNAVSFYEEDGRVYIEGTFRDEGSIASVEIRPQVKRTYKEGYGDPSYVEYGTDALNPFYCEYIYDADVDTWSFKADVTEYAHTNESYAGENYYYNYEWTGNVFIYGGDYGGNDRAYAVTVNTASGLVLSTTSALLYVGDAYDLSVTDNTGSDAAITRTSSNPEVATVDDFGHIVAVAPGQTIVTVSNGTDEAVCVVAVRERPTEVLDFDLAVDSFTGLKPNGELIVKVTNLQPSNVELTEIRWEVLEDDPDLYVGLVNCARYTTDGLTGEIYLNYSAYDPYGTGATPIPGASGTLTVTLNGVSRQMHFDWEDLYKTSTDEDLVSDLFGSEQIVYVNPGEAATLIAKYNNAAAHDVVPVALYTAEGYVQYGSSNPLTPSTGLVLDGPTFASVGGTWTGKIVNTEGYALPEDIHIVYRYDYGYEYELTRNAQYNGYTYDSATGEISVGAPYGSSTTLIIRADGVESPGTPAGSLSGTVYEKPDSLYGPFDWEITSGTGALETAEGVQDSYVLKNVAYYTPTDPGVSYIKATTKDGKFSLNFAVVCEDTMPEVVSLDTHRLTLHVAETASLTATMSPEPILEEHKVLNWVSYNPQAATVDETGAITAVAPGKAFLTVTSPYTGAMSYCIVEVLPCEHGTTETVTVPATCTEAGSVTVTCTICGELVSTEVLPATGHTWGDWVVEKAATCFEDGLQSRLCAVCGEKEEQVIPASSDSCPSKAFTDLDTNRWYHRGVDFVLETGLMQGMSGTLFQPDGQLTRGQTVTILYRLAGSPEATGSVPFTDVADGRYYTAAVAWAYETGIVKGVTKTLFVPEAPVTREQLVTFLARYAAGTGVDITAQGTLEAYPDAASVSPYARPYMAWAVENGIIVSLEGRLAPKGTATRAQAATILYRYCEAFDQ